ncbi:MAG TPA: hypothetical protein VGX68_06610 [Thermoanaerobaculia bacterium]|jgi:hypothetical protein|nr:hypothetical protein [Thermoanaerobaculia bacterium]
MILHRTRRVGAVLAFAAVLALAAPVHAAGWRDLAPGPGWLERALEWIAQLWLGNEEAPGPAPGTEKCGAAIVPDGYCTGATSPP